MITGAIFYPMVLEQQQQHAYASSNTHQFKNGEETHAKQDIRGQHMDQENHCNRSGGCTPAIVGIPVLGNDNSVTGFADQI
jgi:hypothetical protein